MISEFTFIERAVIEVYVYLWFLQRVWSTDRFEHLEWRRLKNMDLKTIITLSILVTMPIQGAFDSIWTFLKYQEGLSPLIEDDGQSQNITWLPKPYFLWADTNYRIKNISEYLLCISFALQTGTLFLIQLFWSHLADQWNGRSFMVSLEFKVYIAWGFISIILFPFARWITRDIFPYTETIPQILFSVELIIIFLLGFRNQRKLFSLLQSIRHQELQKSTGQETILQINYFSEMNMLLSGGALLIGISFLILSADALAKKHVVNSSKFFSDLIMVHCNLGSLILWIIMILIVYPRYYLTGLFGSKLLSKKSLSRISWIPSSNSGKYSDQTVGGGSGPADVGRNSLGGDSVRYSTCNNSNITNPRSYRNNRILDNVISEYGRDSAGNLNRISNESARRSTDQSETFKLKTTNSTTSSAKTLMDGSNSSSTPPSIVRSPIPSPHNSTPSPRELTPSTSTSSVNTFLNHRNSSPLPLRSSTNSPSLRLQTSSLRMTTLLSDNKHTSSMHLTNARTSDDDMSYTSCVDHDYDTDEQSDSGSSVYDNDDNEKGRYSCDTCDSEVGIKNAEQLPDRQRSPTLRFQLTLPPRPQSHPRAHMTVQSWI